MDRKQYFIYITFSQTIERIVESDSAEQAIDKGYQIADDVAELKVINVDVTLRD